MQPLRFRAIFISDVHLGARGAQAEFLLDFLLHTASDYLYLVGDILDFWKMKNGWYWPQTNNNIIQAVLRKAHQGTEVIYIPGNHDELLRNFADTDISGIQIKREAIHEMADGRKMLVIHGDEFDSIVKNNKWLALIGSGAYDVSLFLNRWLNTIRRRCGFGYWSLSMYLKHKVKNAVRYISSFETAVSREASRRKVDGLICGHIHKAAIGEVENVLYANSGDWVENCTALVEHDTGSLQILRWAEESTFLLDRAETCTNAAKGRNVATTSEKML